MPMTGGIASQALKRTTRTRNEAPVFVLGCGRSGTTLLYHMILSAGDFVVYRTESNAMNLLEPRFGDLSVSRNKEKLMDAWLNSKLFWVSLRCSEVTEIGRSFSTWVRRRMSGSAGRGPTKRSLRT